MDQQVTKECILGVSRTADGKTCFRVWAPNAQSVGLIGDFNQWKEDEHLMDRAEDDTFEISLESPKPGDGYKFVITDSQGNKLHKNDPRARELTNSAGHSILISDDFDWEGTEQFQIPSFNELVIYELHLGTFHKKENEGVGSFYTAIEKLDYLANLGINAVEIMPAAEFAGDYSWGYNPASPFAVESAYGGVTGFKTFVREAHKKGIAVILDVVFNHFGPSDLDLWQFDGWQENGMGGIYFYNDWRANTPWGDTRPDYGRGEVRQYIFDNALMWLREFKCDGLRMDMVPYIRNVSADNDPGKVLDDGKSLIQWINREVQQEFPGKIIIAEDMHNLDEITRDVSEGGFGYGSQWCPVFVHTIRDQLQIVNDEDRNMMAVEAALLKKYNLDVFERVVYTESHDEVANGQARLPEEIAPGEVGNYFSVKRGMLAAGLVLTAPGIPMLFQGQELLADGYFDDGDPIDWSREQRYNGLLTFFCDLIRLRRNLEGKSRGLTSQNCEIIHLNNTDKVLAYIRYDQMVSNDAVVVVLNFSNKPMENYGIEIPGNLNWEVCLSSSFGGYSTHSKNIDSKLTGDDHLHKLTIPPYGVIILCATP